MISFIFLEDSYEDKNDRMSGKKNTAREVTVTNPGES